MVIIINEDPVYISWLHRHRDGFVLDTRRKPTRRNTVLHRATCVEIRHSSSKRTHWTTGQKMKACSLDIDELLVWSREQTGGASKTCAECQPTGEPTAAENVLQFPQQTDFHPTRLGQDIVSCVVEVAVIHLDDHTDYDLTMAYVAKYLCKSPAQLTAAVHRLVHEGLLTIDAAAKPGETIPGNCQIFPTDQALRTVPAFRELSDAELAVELNALWGR